MTTLTLTWGALTDCGRKRQSNEDSYLAEPPIFLVADGMGGHEGGAEASRKALEAFQPLTGLVQVTSEQVETAFGSAVQRVRDITYEHAAAGTTLTGVTITDRAGELYWMVINIGDSRTYRLTLEHGLEQISVDHSAVQELIDSGAITAAQAEAHPDRSVITRAIGAGSHTQPDYWLLPADPGDRLLICSDGLVKEVGDSRIAEILAANPDPQTASESLVAEAIALGGSDNITVIVINAEGTPDTDSYDTQEQVPISLPFTTVNEIPDDATIPRPSNPIAKLPTLKENDETHL